MFSAPTDDPMNLILSSAGRYKLLTPAQEITHAKRIQGAIALLQSTAEAQDPKWAATAFKGGQLQKTVNMKGLVQWALPLLASTQQKALKRGLRSREALVESNMRLVVSIAKKDAACRRGKHSLEMSDLVQEGALGLCRAAEKFNPEAGCRFSTYAYWWIKQAIWRAIAEQGRTIRFPIHFGDQLHKLHRIEADFRQRDKPTGHADVAPLMYPKKDLDAAIKAVEALRQARREMGKLTSLDVSLTANSDARLGDLLASTEPSQWDSAEQQNAAEIAAAEIAKYLTPAEADVVLRRVEGETLDAIGIDHNLSRERVRQIQNAAIRQLRTSPQLRELNASY